MDALEAPALAEIVTEVNRLRAAPGGPNVLADMLAEQSPIYCGRSTAEAEQLRSYILAGFEQIGMPASVTAFVVEALQTGMSVHVVAAAARALRGGENLPANTTPLLLAAIERIRGHDDVVRLDQQADDQDRPVTALMELFRTLAWLGARAAEAEAPLKEMLRAQPSPFSARVRAEIETALAAVACGHSAAPSCCASEPPPISFAPPVATQSADIGSIEMQDQDGTILTLDEFLAGRPSVLTFFYTRCMNPDKCSLTITRLARLQQLIAAAGMQGTVNVAALTYDPAFDLPDRLRSYGAARSMVFDIRNRLLRTTGPFTPIQRWLDLGVGYGSTTVNQHRIDLVILDSARKPRAGIVRQQWHEGQVFAALKDLMSGHTPAKCCH